MKREIKFKAWDKKSKVIRDVIDLKFRSSNYYVMLSDPTHSAPENWTLRNKNEVILMQATGLLDRRKDEIYEGYILKTDSGTNQFVKYRDDMAAFVCSFNEGASTNIQSDWIIIGNIYEHPELLETQKSQLSAPKVE